MTKGITVESNVRFQNGTNGRKNIREGAAKPTPVGRVPRVAKLMALAIRFDQLLRDEAVKDQAELARLGHVTRARVTQIMNLQNLAPDIQEAILFLADDGSGRERVTERDLRPIAAEVDWREQRERCGRLARDEPRLAVVNRQQGDAGKDPAAVAIRRNGGLKGGACHGEESQQEEAQRGGAERPSLARTKKHLRH